MGQDEFRRATRRRACETHAALLEDIGCTVPIEALERRTPAELAEAARWAEAILFGMEDLPERPAWLAGHDCRRCRRCGCTDAHGCPEGCSWAAADLCSLCVAPRSLRELIAFLGRRPRVVCTGLDQVVTEERFLRADGAGFLFRREDADGAPRDVFLPVNCRQGAAGAHESGLAFDADGFSLTKFGRTVRYTYCRGPNA